MAATLNLGAGFLLQRLSLNHSQAESESPDFPVLVDVIGTEDQSPLPVQFCKLIPTPQHSVPDQTHSCQIHNWPIYGRPVTRPVSVVKQSQTWCWLYRQKLGALTVRGDHHPRITLHGFSVSCSLVFPLAQTKWLEGDHTQTFTLFCLRHTQLWIPSIMRETHHQELKVTSVLFYKPVSFSSFYLFKDK